MPSRLSTLSNRATTAIFISNAGNLAQVVVPGPNIEAQVSAIPYSHLIPETRTVPPFVALNASVTSVERFITGLRLPGSLLHLAVDLVNDTVDELAHLHDVATRQWLEATGSRSITKPRSLAVSGNEPLAQEATCSRVPRPIFHPELLVELRPMVVMLRVREVMSRAIADKLLCYQVDVAGDSSQLDSA